MFKMISFVVGLALMGASPATAQKVVFRGIIPSAPHTVVRLMEPVSPFHSALQTIASDTSAADGSFVLEAPIGSLSRLAVDVWFQHDFFLAMPGDTLDIRSDAFISGNALPGSESAGFYETTTDSLSIRYILTRFEAMTAMLMDSVFEQVYRKRNLQAARFVIAKLRQQAQGITNPVANNFMRYQILALSHEMMIRLPSSIVAELTQQQPDYDNPAYMELIVALFYNYHLKSNKLLESNCMKYAQQGSYTALLDELGSDTLLKNELIRELAAIEIIGDIAAQLPVHKRLPVIALLDSLALRTKFAHHQRFAQDLAHAARQLLPDTKAPSLTQRGEMTCDTLKGFPLIILFTHTHCASCNESAEWLSEFIIREKWPGKVITAFTDANRNDFDLFGTKTRWPWQSILIGDQVEIIQQWQARSLPLTAIVNPDCTLQQFPGFLPGPDSEKQLRRLVEVSRPARRPMRPAPR